MRLLSALSAGLLLASCADAFVTPGPNQRMTSMALREGPLDILGGIGQTLTKEIGGIFKKSEEAAVQVEAEPAKPQYPDVVIEPDYKLGIIFLTAGFLLDVIPYIQLTLGPIVTLLGVLFVVQTARIRFCFDGTAFELKTSGGEDGGLADTGENIVVGGENRWTYDSFVNYEFFP